jgi:hypothetical protein
MPWEKRRNTRSYDTKRRRGNRVISDYVGAGESAGVIATLEALYREQRIAQQQQWRLEQESRRALDAEVDRLGSGIRTLVAATLLANGYHTHKGQWRSRNEQQANHSAEGSETARESRR